MGSSSDRSTTDSQALLSELCGHDSSIQGGFNAYAQTVKHHSLILDGAQKGLEELNQGNATLDAEIEELEQSNMKEDATIDMLEMRIHELPKNNDQQQLGEQHDEGLSVNSAKGAALEERNAELRRVVEDKEDIITKMEQEIAQLKALEIESNQVEETKAKARAAREKLTKKEKEKMDKILGNAAANGNTAVVEAFLNRGSNMEAYTKVDSVRLPVTALMVASSRGHLDTVQLLVSRGAIVEAKDEDDRTPLFYASVGRHIPVMETLIANGANLNARGAKNFTPLIVVSMKGYLEEVKVLIERGANLNLKNDDSFTALFLAAFYKHLPVLAALISAGADMNVASPVFGTALDTAERRGHPKVFKMLEAAGAKRAPEL